MFEFKEKLQNPRANIDPNAGDTLQVIGAGLPRTGTSSLVAAMEILGFGPSFHFTEVVYNLEYASKFERLLQAFRIPGSRFAPKSNEESDAMKDELRSIFRGYKSSLDSPACHFVPELMDLYPDAKVLLSVRDNDEVWWRSIQDTIGMMQKRWYQILTLPTRRGRIMQMEEQTIEARKQGTGGKSRAELHSMHNRMIRGIVPEEKLLEVCTSFFRHALTSRIIVS